ncbi:phenylalanine--tRNA ligase subunit beta [Helicobacter didelphidarum]|uniref:Phenylalanine--tRNA ligase beta subunit n=1 Tax=Helicobacter didelphidarum TaxID=2040648 RepID=A0A3D8IM53_9HELI|nr:phenylalanine--tRNA ligase subunit beta [Helicobacter didelphidarum]RDU66090.1 phenylalanine--tRNA ligase subunit beta [Helicobacter didelphidarum]
MIVTYEDLKKFIHLDGIEWSKVVTILSSIGLEVEKESFISIPKNVIVAKVLKKYQHPNADRLNVCEVDTGKKILQIVCGAKNVRAEQFVALALPDALLPFGKNKATIIQKSEIRGVESNGMLCSSIELGLPKINDGILELDSSIGNLILGKELCSYPVFHQPILELGITPNRGDCLSVLGVARDIASIFHLIIKNIIPVEPSVALGVGRFLQIVPHGELHSSLLYRLVEIKEAYTPLSIALTLGLIGKYNDDVVINFMQYTTYMTGVLFNAYAMDSKEVSYNGKEVRLLVKNDENGLESVYAEIKDNNKNITTYKLNEIGANFHILQKHDYPRTLILEASFIDSEYISNKLYGKNKTNFNHEIIHHSTRGTNPDLELGMSFLCEQLSALKIMLYSGIQEIIRAKEPTNIHMTFGYISDCIGNNVAKEEIALILKQLNFRIQATCDENFFIAQPPAFRNDIKNRQDIAEEVLRFCGIDKIVSKPYTIQQVTQNTPAYLLHKQIKTLRMKALGNGYIECVHYIFDNTKVLNDLGFETLHEEKALINPITSELDTLRPSLLPHILETLKKNKRYGYESIKVFEIGHVYNTNRDSSLKFACAMSDYLMPPTYPNTKGIEVDFFSFAQNISQIIGHFDCSNISSQFIPNKLIHPYQSGNILKDGEKIGVISKLHPNIAKKYSLDSVFFCEVDLAPLLYNNENKKAHDFSKYQANKRDLTILIAKGINFSAIKLELDKSHLKNVKEIFPLDIFSENDSTNALSIRLIFQSSESTLNESQMQETLQQVLDMLEKKFHAKLKV